MRATRGVVALAMLAVFGCDDDACPGIGEHPGGIVTVEILSEVSGDCVTPPVSDELNSLITVNEALCPIRDPSYSDAMCAYHMEVGCGDDISIWAWVVDAEWIADGVYQGHATLQRAEPDGTYVCRSQYLIRYTDV